MNSRDREILSQALLTELFGADPRSWRVRQVLQITPVSPETYRARTSLQFLLSRDLVANSWHRAFGYLSDSPVAPSLDEVDVILPLEFMPKYVLLDFSLHDQSGTPLSLLPSSQTSLISFGMVRKALDALDLLCDDGRRTAGQLLERYEGLLFALVASGQGEIVGRLSHLGDFPRHWPTGAQFQTAMFHFCHEGLRQFTREER